MTKLFLRTVHTCDLTDSEKDEIAALCTAAFGDDCSLLFTKYIFEGLHSLGTMGDRLVSHAVVTTRWLQPENQPLLRTAYVDAVATLPAFQNQGYGGAVMRYLAEAITDFDVACLQTERVSFYAQNGWKEWTGPLAGRARTGELIPTPGQKGVMVLALPRTPALDFNSLLSIEDQVERIW